MKTLDAKLARIHGDPLGARDFILADAKDADMAFGMAAPGAARPGSRLPHKSLEEYREQVRQVIAQGLVDIVLMSASTSEQLALIEKRFVGSPITPAARANDATDVHILRGGAIHTQHALPFRTASIDHLQAGRLDPTDAERKAGVNLGLYSVTLTNDAERDRHTLEQYKAFREEAERKGFRHFLEVFDPNVEDAVPADQVPGFVNDAIARALAGVPRAGRPVFLKIVYHGPAALEELVHYDPHLVVGVLGGSAGTTYDAFKLLAEAKKHGARAALYGRKINHAEHQLAFIQFLRLIADGEIEPEEAVKAYHGVLQRLGVKPLRALADDLQLQTNVMSYAGNGKTISVGPRPTGGKPAKPSTVRERAARSEPDFTKMTPAQKVEWNLARWKRILG